MALFAKNKPTQRLDFEGGFVELQYISKGVKDEIKRRTMEVYGSIDNEELKALQKSQNDDEIPVSLIGSAGKILEIQYYKLAHAIRSWSDNAEITEETVKELDEDIFDKISQKIDGMNALKQTDEKN